ncbi:hypothetical protein KIW84_024168 [Lathyrus oleraceus]|uniref:Uncharacterized protein n=1 Tax=Pisum sativum TaxID=3888 RepID=A0A9D4YIP5_PEA|nr:hypothetical protein KIW84_024168 [Pisum sativum]
MLMLKPLAALSPSLSASSVARRMSSSPTFPKFISVEAADIHSRTRPDGFRFSLVSYNILAQAYVKSIIFPYSPRSSLRWSRRSNSILDVLKNLGADFFCLQVFFFFSFRYPNFTYGDRTCTIENALVHNIASLNKN